MKWPGMPRRRFLGLALAVSTPAFGRRTLAATEPVRRELVRDAHFQDGFTLLDPRPGKRVPCGHLPGLVPGRQPVWFLAQWHSRHALGAGPPALRSADSVRYGNQAKAVTTGRPGTQDADMILAVQATNEYGTRSRQAGEPWVHWLVEQDLEDPPALDTLASARFQIEVRLKSAQQAKTGDYDPDPHAAQFQVALTVQNLDRGSPGYGKFLWFGIPLYDNRARVPKAHQALDTAGSGMFIHIPPGETFTRKSAHDGDWLVVDRDLLPLLREGLEAAWARGHLLESRLWSAYRIASLNLGWEVPGIFDVAMQVRNLGLQATTATG